MSRPVILDGAFGTCLWAEAEKQNIAKVSTWRYNIEEPKLLESIIKAYAAAGSEIIYSNTFVANRTNLEAEHEGDKLEAVIRNGIRLVRESSDCKVAFSSGALPKMLQPLGNMTEQEVEDVYREVFDIAIKENPDMIILETFMDLNMLEIAARVAKETELPLICSMSFDAKGRTILGNSVGEMIERLSPLGLSGIGMNCSVGPESAVKIIEEFKEKTNLPLLVKPNSADLNADDFAEALKPCFDKVSYIGACCGSNPEYIAKLKAALESL